MILTSNFMCNKRLRLVKKFEKKSLKKKYGETFSGVIRFIEHNQYFR